MTNIIDGSIQRDHVAGHHVEAKLFDGSLNGILVFWTQDKGFSSFSKATGDPWRLGFFGLQVSKDAFLEDGTCIRMSVGLERHILLLDHLLLIGLLLGRIRMLLAFA